MQCHAFLLILSVVQVIYMTSDRDGQCSSLTCQQHVYHFISEKKSWSEAQTYCREKYTDLATVDSMDMNRVITSLLPQASPGKGAWIGLKDNHGERRWYWTFPGLQYNESYWNGGEPNDFNSVLENCTVMNSGGKLLDITCGIEPHGFICYNGSGSNIKFYLEQTTKTWRDAQEYCREKYTDLASVRDDNDITTIKQDITSSAIVYIGLFRDSWKWSDGRNASFRNWSPDTSDKKKDCGVIIKYGSWSNNDCDEKMPFICYDDKLVLIRDHRTWRDALEYCRAHYHDLVSVYNEHMQDWVKQRAKMADTLFVWLGLKHLCPLDYWYWVSDEPFCYHNWAYEDKIEECGNAGAIEKEGGHWFSRSKSEKHNFICTKKALPYSGS